MRKFMLLISMLMLFPILALAQLSLESFDADYDSTYWEYEYSENADSLKGWINRSVETTEVQDGAGAMKLEYSVHNIEGWGGYSKIFHMAPGAEVYNWSAYDSISFWYYNSVKQSLENRVELRFELYDVSGDIPDTTSNPGDTEFYYSFHKVLDMDPGWNEIKMPLTADPNAWSGEMFNRTGWAGVLDNGELDKDAIKGFAFEFSISGGGEGDVGAGTIIIDNLSLKGSKNLVKVNPGFEEDLNGWGTAQGGGYIEVKTGDAASGDKFVEIGVNDNAWAVAWQDSILATAGTEYQLAAMIKDVSAEDLGASYAALKLEAHRADNSVIQQWEDIQDGISRDWGLFSTSHIMPPETYYINAVLVATKWSGDGKSAAYGFDDVALINMGVADTTAPDQVQNVRGVPDAGSHSTLVVWDLLTEEEDETYTVYASENPITDLNAVGVEKLGTTTDDVNSMLHHLIYPIVDHEVTYYYAVTCTDKAANTGLPGFSDAVVNTAKGSAAISMTPPATFAADGDLSEWFNSDIMPFEFKKSLGSHVAVGDANSAFDDDDDMTITGYLAVDDDYLYAAFDIVDNVYSYDSAGNFWEDDVVELYIGLYNQTEIHKSYERGDEPDYKFVFLSDVLNLDLNGLQPMYPLASNNYEFVNFGVRDWAVEVKISLDSLAAMPGATDDARFHAQRGMKISLDMVFHDSDSPNQRDGAYSYSPNNFDNSWSSPENWYFTWIGDTNKVATAIGDPVKGVVREFNLQQNYPNPFNPVTNIQYTVPSAGKVSLTVYNIVGQKIATLVNSKQTAGIYTVQFDGAGLASGVYFYKLEAQNHVQVNKMLLVK